ncbi:MAG: NAD-dependent epimerase/dehydratase family protein [Bacillota bacterium]
MTFSKILSEDLECIVSDRSIPWARFRDKTILVTGSTGLIGLALVRALYAANQKRNLRLHILAHGRDAIKMQKYLSSCGAVLVEQDIRLPFAIPEPVHYVFHCAGITESAEMVANPISVIETSVLGTMRVLELAKVKRVEALVFLSSMEVYGLITPPLPSITERDLGSLDLSSVRSCYPESKRLCENLCNCYYFQYGVPTRSARLAQTFGAGTPKDDPRVFAQFARHAMNGTDIVLHTDGKSRGNYCYLSDAIRALLLLAHKGENGEAYNVSNPAASMTIREMADLVATDLCGSNIKVVVVKSADFEKFGYAPDTDNRLNTDKLNRLGWSPTYGLKEMYERLLDYWSECEDA